MGHEQKDSSLAHARLWLILLPVVAVVGAALVSFARAHGLFRTTESLLRETEKITLVVYNPRQMEFVFGEDPEEVRRLVDTISLVPKDPCECAFAEHLVFHTPHGEVKVYVSDHSFYVSRGKRRWQSYRMAAGFWLLFQAYRQRALTQPKQGDASGENGSPADAFRV